MGAVNQIVKYATKAATKEAGESATKALTRKAAKEITKAVTNEATKTATKAAAKAVNKLVKGGTAKSSAEVSKLIKGAALSGAGESTLAKNAGSTLDGVLGKTSGVSLPNAKKKTVSDIYGVKTSALDLFNKGELDTDSLDALKADGRLSSSAYNKLKKAAISTGRDLQEASMSNTLANNRSQLPKIKTSDYVKATGYSGKDIPSGMKPYLSENGVPLDDGAKWGEIFPAYNNANEGGSFSGTADDIISEYERALSTPKANTFYTNDNVATVLRSDEGASRAVEQALVDAYGNKTDIPVSGSSSASQKVDVKRPTATTTTANTGASTAASDEASDSSGSLAEEIAGLKDRIGAYGGGNGGGSIYSSMVSPAGSDGYNVKLKTGDTTTVNVGNVATGSTKRQRAIRNLNDMTAKNMNASRKQYQSVVGKSGSIDGYYNSVAERMRAEKIDQANVADKTQAALALREDIKQQGLKYAEDSGVTVNLSGVDNTIGLSTAQRRKLDELGLGLRNMLGDWAGAVKPTDAEDIYKTLREYANTWSDSKDALTKMAGNACRKEAEAVRNAIDNTMDNINVDYKTPLVQGAAANGEDPAYLRRIAQKTDFKFSDLRRDQSDWMTIGDLSGNPIRDDPTINIAGVDTGIKNPFKAAGERAREKYYERVANGGGAGGSGGGYTAGAGASGASGGPNNIIFENTGSSTSKLGNMLGKYQNLGLVGGGLLGGLLLGGNGGDSSESSTGTLEERLRQQQLQSRLDDSQQGTANSDGFYGLTIGGYSHEQLENGYVAAIMAGDPDAAEIIANMMGILEDKATAYAKTVDDTDSSTDSKVTSALSTLSELYDLYNSINGGTGPVAGNITNFMNSITGGGYNTEANTYWQVARGSLSRLIKGMGDSGALSDTDQKTALAMLPTITDTKEAAEQKFAAIYDILAGAQ